MTIDMPDENRAAFEAMLRDCRLDFQVEENGPGGGNPCFTVTVETRESAQLIIDFYFGAEAGR